jgi:hypothetical protein
MSNDARAAVPGGLSVFDAYWSRKPVALHSGASDDLAESSPYVTDATLTFPMLSRSGREFSPAEIRERTELVLDGRFARVVTTADALR